MVRSEAVWNVHINAKQHKHNVEMAKKLKERTKNFTTPLKRPLSPPRDVPDKRPRGILKNSAEPTSVNLSVSTNNQLPEGFFDNKNNSKRKNASDRKTNQQERVQQEENMETDEALPEGFFDDPKMDAKVNQHYYNSILLLCYYIVGKTPGV